MMSNHSQAKNQLKKMLPPVWRGGVLICRLVAASNDRSSRFLVLLVVVDLGELGIDDIVLLGFGTAAAFAAAAAAAGLLLGLLVHRLAELHRRLGQCVGLGGDGVRVGALQGLLEIGQGGLDCAPVGLADFCAMLGQSLLGRMDQSLGVVLGLDLGFALLVFLGVRLGVLDHLVDVGLAQAARRLDADLLLLAGALVPGRDVDDAVGVDVERDFDLPPG